MTIATSDTATRKSGQSSPTGAQGNPPPVISSAALLSGQREVLIRHGAEHYRLRLTAANRLILTK